MSEILKTVIIKTENGPVTINESDLTDEHELYIESSTTLSIQDMKKDQLTAYMLENGITLPDEIKNVGDIKAYLLSLENSD